MSFIKHSEGEISNILKSNDDMDLEKTKKVLKEAKEEVKNSNNTELSKESE